MPILVLFEEFFNRTIFQKSPADCIHPNPTLQNPEDGHVTELHVCAHGGNSWLTLTFVSMGK